MMHRITLSLLLIVSVLLVLRSEASFGAAYQMPNTEMHVMTTTTTRNREYMLYLQLPEGYHKPENNQKRYPAIYLLDPYWDFPVVAGSKSGLVFDGIVPDYIVVGIGYSKNGVVEEGEAIHTLRQIDFTPVRDSVDTNTGDAEAFLGFIQSDVIPFVENRYRIDDYRVLAGTSWGGLFSIYAMFEEPGLFQGHIAITPAVGRFHRWAFVRESKFFSSDPVNDFGPSKQSLPTRLYMSVGTDDQLGNFTQESQAFSQLLMSRNYEGFEFKFELKEADRHASVKLSSFGHGLKHAFSGYQNP